MKQRHFSWQKKKIKSTAIFSGSDWCQNCIRFDREILKDKSFQNFSSEKLVVLKVDFPQRKKQSKELIQQNENLAARFNPTGAVPAFVLLDHHQKQVQKIEYRKQSPTDFIKQLHPHFKMSATLREYHKKVPLMGSFFEFILVEKNDREPFVEEVFQQCIYEVQRIEYLISEWIDTSAVGILNQTAGRNVVRVPLEVYQLIERSIAISELTQGAFDITFHALSDLWKFDGSMKKLPDEEKVKALLKKVGFKKIQLMGDQKVYLDSRDMAIGFGGIGQGYAVAQVKKLLLEKGIQNFVINSSGDVYAHGKRADGTPWKVAVADPFDTDRMIQWLPAENIAVVTSGNYEKFFEVDGKKYSHIINPKTGYPAQGVVSVTIVHPHPEVADALATAVFVLGREVGMDLVNQLPDTHCILIDDKKNVYFSDEIKNYSNEDFKNN